MMRAFLLLIGLCLIPGISVAAEFIAQPSDLTVVAGETVLVYVQVQSEEFVNAVSGEMRFDTTILTLESVSDGNSIIGLWVESPRERNTGVISFSGITPGGFTGSQKPLFTLRFRALQPGSTTIFADSLRLLAHDGKGTDIPVAFRPVTMTVVSGIPGTFKEPLDTEPPENFTPIIVPGDPTTIIFSTVDKGEGAIQYFVREYQHPWVRMFSRWLPIASPYQVEPGTEQYYREIMAVDAAGNERRVELIPDNPEQVPWIVGLFWLMLVSMAGLVWFFSKTKR